MARVVVVGSNTRKRRVLQIAVTVFIIALTVFMLTPFVWMISSSFKREADVMAQPFQLVPSYTYLKNYVKVLELEGGHTYNFLRSYWNSIKVSVLATLVSVSSSCLAGYAFGKLRFRGSNILFLLY